MLLEPILRCRFTVPSSCAGRLMSDLAQMRGRFDAPQTRGELTMLYADLPAATSLEYPTALAAYTGGRGAMAAQLKGYEPVDLFPGRDLSAAGRGPAGHRALHPRRAQGARGRGFGTKKRTGWRKNLRPVLLFAFLWGSLGLCALGGRVPAVALDDLHAHAPLW